MSSPPPTPFLFPQAHSTVIPDPSLFFSPTLLSNPLPTNSFYQNFVLGNGDTPEYIHPYIVKSSNSSLSFSFPSFLFNASFIYQIFVPDLTISASKTKYPDSQRNQKTHIISSYDDLSVTLDFPSSNLRFFLVRGSPYITFSVLKQTEVSISTSTTNDASILSISSTNLQKKHTLKLSNNQTWLIYTSSPISFTRTLSTITTSEAFSGIVRIAINPDDSNSNLKSEQVLDRFSSRYPLSGGAEFKKPFSLEYRWQKKGYGDLLMLAHPLHLRLLSENDSRVTVLNDFKYRSIDGDLVGVVGDSWTLKTNPVPITWHSIRGVDKESQAEIVAALRDDVKALNATSINTTSSYFYGKLIARAARLALIAEEVSFAEPIIPKIEKFLKDSIEPWLNGTFKGNGFLHDPKWGGIVTELGETDKEADFGFGIYNDHHFHLGYFLYSIAVLAKIDPAWGIRYRPQAYSLVQDFMNYGKKSNSNPNYPNLRNFDLYKLHSWAAGLTVFPNGRNQESTSEAINAYYSAALMGLAYGDADLVATGTMLATLEIQAAQMWWHVREEEDGLYGGEFEKENRVIGIVWSIQRDSGLWFAPAEWRECRLGIQVLPLLPITEVVFSDFDYVKDLVNWTLPALEREGGVGEGWKGFIYAMEGIYDRDGALEKIRELNGYDDGNSLSNLLWWIHSRGKEDKRR